MNFPKKDLDKFVIIGDRILLKPSKLEHATKSGLLLPPGLQEREQIQSGYILKVGPGYPLPSMEPDEPWKDPNDSIKYLPLQVQVGDLAIFLQKHSYELTFNGEKYLILSQSSVLMVIRDEF